MEVLRPSTTKLTSLNHEGQKKFKGPSRPLRVNLYAVQILWVSLPVRRDEVKGQYRRESITRSMSAGLGECLVPPVSVCS